MTIDCRDIVECCWHLWNATGTPLVSRNHIRDWCEVPLNRENEKWAPSIQFGGAQALPIWNGGICAQRKTLRVESNESPQRQKPLYRPAPRGVPTPPYAAWVVRWKAEGSKPRDVLYSLSPTECAEAFEKATEEAGEREPWNNPKKGVKKCHRCGG